MTFNELQEKRGLDEMTIGALLMNFIAAQHPEIIEEFDEHLGGLDIMVECPHCGEDISAQNMEDDECIECGQSLLPTQEEWDQKVPVTA